MNADEGNAAERVLVAMAAHVQRDPRLYAEEQRARREFFRLGPGLAAPAAGPAIGAAAERRFLEWFLLEHDSAVLGAAPVEVPPYADLALELPESITGVFLVQPITHGLVQARDLQDDTTLDLSVPTESLRGGDLLVGRLWAEGAGRWSPSTALAVIRPGAQLAIAFTRDLQRLELDRRLRQIELEHLLLLRPNPAGGVLVPADTATVPLEHLEADLDRLLQASGSEVAATDVSQQLGLASRPGPVMGPLLDRLAFDSVVDLDRARALLLAIWNAHHADDPPAAENDGLVAEELGGGAGTPPGETLGERLVRTLDEGLAEKRDVAELFAQLERMAGIEPDPEDADDLLANATAGEDAAHATEDDEADGDESGARPRASFAGDDADDEADGDDGSGRPRDPRLQRASQDEADDGGDDDDAASGDLGPLVEEYLWEQGRGEDPAAAPLRMFADLQRNTPLPHNDLEQVTTADVMRLLLHVYLASAPHERAAAVRTAHEQIRGFFAWAVAEQEIPVGGVLAGCRGALLDHLDRLQAAGEALSTPGRGGGRPGILRVEELGKGGFGVGDDDGGTHWVQASETGLQHLREGDLVLGALQPAGAAAARQFVGLVVVLPADAKALME